ncbi:Sister chromatid cohesion protein 2 [Coemansia brasiliensis]|uniref:Sister chromatid cohesion protein n=1 Tax=Coemansia brasiliensis TaxID=2650707 RepID=A0A9W8I764_9FUNG|nr:Sister chromatid cohesion protein 2 [Coemansia brasiliensis]
MKPIDTKVPAETQACLRYWPVNSAMSLDIGFQTPYESTIEMDLKYDLSQLSLSSDGPVLVGMRGLVHDIFNSNEIQKIKLKKDCEPAPPIACSASLESVDSITALTQQHPSLTLQSKDLPKQPASASSGYEMLRSYISKSTEAEPKKAQNKAISATNFIEPNSMDTDTKQQTLKRQLAIDNDLSTDAKIQRTCIKPRSSDTMETLLDNDINGLVITEEPKSTKEPGSVSDIKRSIEPLDDFLSELLAEEDDSSKLSLLQHVSDISGASAVVLRKYTVRRVSILMEPCTAEHLSQSISSDKLGRLIGLLASTIQSAKDASLAAMLRDGMLVDRGTELAVTFCKQLENSMERTCLGLEVAVLVFNLVASSKGLHVCSMGDLLHDAVVFIKEILLDCIVPVLDMDADCELARTIFDAEKSTQLQALFAATLAGVSSVAAIPTLNSLDIIPLVYATISVMFCSSSLLDNGVVSNLFESIRRSSQLLLRNVFELRTDQRTWILEEILASLIKLPAQKRAQTIHRIAGGKSVQFITVLLLQLLQATAQSPEDLTAGFEGGTLSAKEYRILLQRHKKAVSMVSSSADFVIRYIISRCAKRESKSNEAEYRTLLELFIDDCIVLLGHPQWPAAELVVRIYSLHAMDILDEDKHDILLKNMALESAAQIASHIALSASNGAKTLSSITPQSSLESIERFHKSTATLLEYLQSKAIGGESSGAIPLYIGNWASMLFATLIKGSGAESAEDSDNSGGSSDFSSSDDDDSQYEEQASDCKRVKQPTHCKSIFDAQKRKAVEDCLKTYATIAHRSTKVLATNSSFVSAAEAAKATLALLPLYGSFDMLLTRVTLALGASQVSLRSKALRALNQIALHQPAILYQNKVKYAINHRLQDSSPQVREAAIDLIGKHISHNRELTNQYYEFISVRVLDKGPSVRRRVMRILADIYASSENIEQLVDIGVRLLQRTNDDERTIRELAFKMLQDLWFSYSRRSDDDVDNDDEDVVADAHRNVFNTLSPEAQKSMLKRVHVMIGVVDMMKSYDLIDLMAKLFEHVSTGSSKPETDDALFVIRCVIDALFELLLRAEDRDNESNQKNEGFSVAMCLRFISTLSTIAPEAVGLHAESLSTYLQQESSAEDAILVDTLTIFNNTLLTIPHPSVSFLRSVEDDLVRLLSSSPQNVLAIAVPCLCTLIDKLTRNYAKLIRLFRSCVLQLCREQRVLSTNNRGVLSHKNIMRFIILAGLTCRYFDFDQHREQQKDVFKELNQLAKGSMIDLLHELLLFYALPQRPAPVQLAAIQMLGQLHIKRPRLAVEPQSRKIMDQAFASESANQKLQVLRNFLEFLRTDAKQLAEREREDRAQGRKIDAKALVGNTGNMSEAGVGASLMQTYLDRIIDATFVANVAALRAAGFEVISLVVEQGLAHPLKCMPALIALCTSNDPYIRSKSLKLHQELSFKHASFIHSRDLEGVRKAYEYQLLVHEHPEKVTGYDENTDARERLDRPAARLQFLYSLSRSRRTRRNELLSLLVKVCDFDSGTAAYADTSSTDVPFVRFVAENLSALEFKYLDEVLHVIYQISSVIASSGLNLYQQIEAENNGDGQTKSSQWWQATRASACIGILFVLREFLKSHYGISETRCSSYNPSDASSVRDKSVSWHTHGDGGRIDWSQCPFALQRMDSVSDGVQQRKHFQKLMAQSMAAVEESPSLNGKGQFAADERSDDADDVVLSAEELDMLAAEDMEH